KNKCSSLPKLTHQCSPLFGVGDPYARHDVVFVKIVQMAKLRHEPTEIAHTLPQDRASFGFTFFWKGERQVSHAYSAVWAVHCIEDRPDPLAQTKSQRKWENPKK